MPGGGEHTLKSYNKLIKFSFCGSVKV
jgi:hypothetical protein